MKNKSIALESGGATTSVRIGATVLHFASTQLVGVETIHEGSAHVTLRDNTWGNTLVNEYAALVRHFRESSIEVTMIDRRRFTEVVADVVKRMNGADQ